MKACAVAVVSAALFGARVHAANFVRTETFVDETCTDDLRKQREEVLLEVCTARYQAGQTFYVKDVCTATEWTRTFYSDDQCTTLDPDRSTEGETLNECDGREGKYEKTTCPIAKDDALRVVVQAYDSDTCEVGQEREPGDDASWELWLDECHADSDYNGAMYPANDNWEERWTDRSFMTVMSGGAVSTMKYATVNCSGDATAGTMRWRGAHPHPFQETADPWPLCTCTCVFGSSYVNQDVCGGLCCERMGVVTTGDGECPPTTTTAATTAAATTTTNEDAAGPTTTTIAETTAAPARASVTAAHVAALAGLLWATLL